VRLVSEATITLGLAQSLAPPIIDQTQIIDLGVRRHQRLGGILTSTTKPSDQHGRIFRQAQGGPRLRRHADGDEQFGADTSRLKVDEGGRADVEAEATQPSAWPCASSTTVDSPRACGRSEVASPASLPPTTATSY